MTSIFKAIGSLFGGTPFGDLTPDELDCLAIERLSDANANWDETCRGIDALGRRRRPEDIDRLVSLSLAPALPTYISEWISEALLTNVEDAEAVHKIAGRCGPATSTLLLEMFYAANPEWKAILKPPAHE